MWGAVSVKLAHPDEEPEPDAEALPDALCEPLPEAEGESEGEARVVALLFPLRELFAVDFAVALCKREPAAEIVGWMPRNVKVAACDMFTPPPPVALPDVLLDTELEPEGDPLTLSDGAADEIGIWEAGAEKEAAALLRVERVGRPLPVSLAEPTRRVPDAANDRLGLCVQEVEPDPEEEAHPETELLPEAEPLPDTEGEEAGVPEASGDAENSAEELVLGLTLTEALGRLDLDAAATLPLLLPDAKMRVGLAERDTQLLAVGDCEAQPEGEGEPEADAEPLDELLLRAESDIELEAEGDAVGA